MSSLKNIPRASVILFVVLALVISLSNVSDAWRVHVVNGLSNNKVLFVHCKSGDDDLGMHNLTVGTETNWEFERNIFGTTLFWCYVSQRETRVHRAFDVFWKNYDLFEKCNYSDCIWIAKDFGIYLKDIPKNVDVFLYYWELGATATNSSLN